MERLTSYQLQTLLEFLRQMYAPASLDGFKDRLVGNIRKLIPCEIASYDEMVPDRHTSIDRGSPPGAFPDRISRLWQRVMHEHPVLMHCQQTGDLHSHRISDFYSQTQFHALALYHEYYKKISVEDALCKGIRVSGPLVIGCGLHRSRRSFTDRDRIMFDLIGPHLTQAWRNAELFTRIQAETRLIGRTLDQIERGIVILDHMGRIRMMTDRARGLIAECFGPYQDSSRLLPESLQLWVCHQLSLVDSVDSLKPRSPLVVEREGRQVEFRLIVDSGRTMLLIEERKTVADASELRRLGLTRREAEVLAWVAEGKTNSEIATILDMSPRTVQKHMEHVMAKLGVETRTAAARTALHVMKAS